MTVIPQHMVALSKANQIKTARAELKKKITGHDVTVAAVVLANQPDTQTMTVFSLLHAQYGWGRERVVRFLRSVPISETRTVGQLTERQRGVIATRLDPREWYEDAA